MPQLPKWVWGSSGGDIRLPKSQVHDVDERPEKQARTLKHLIKANHLNHSIIYNNLRFHNHAPHALGSAYILGANADELTYLYDSESKVLESWKSSPGEIAKHDWRTFLGKKEYQRAFVDFFEDQLVQLGYDWKGLLDEFLFSGPEPLINNLIAGLAHPLIHLGYAYELSSKTIAIEALGLAACFYNEWNIYLNDPKYTFAAPNPSDSLFAILSRVAQDKRFDNLSEHQGPDNIDKILGDDKLANAALEYWNSWELKNPTEQFAESQKLAVALVVAAKTSKNPKQYDFFGVHLLTSSHAVRVLLPLLPSQWQVPLVRQWWLFTLLVYIAQLRPTINIDDIKLVELQGRNWKFVTDKALKGEYRTDAHYVKALRSMHEASKTWGDVSQFYLKAAVKMADEFHGWGGFDANEMEG